MRNSKSIKRKRNIFFIFSIIFSYLPIIIFLIIGFCTAQPVQKLQLTTTCVAAIILLFLSIFKYKSLLKSVIWLILVGLCLVMNEIALIIIICGTADIISELVLVPLYQYYKRIYNESANSDDLAEKIGNAMRR